MKPLKLFVSLLIPYTAAAIGSSFTSQTVSTWYVELVKPAFNPPNWIFGPVWTVLYLLIGISLYLVWTAKAKKKTGAYASFGVQMFLNAIWSPIFFGLKSPSLALFVIFLLLPSIIATIIKFNKISKKSAYLLVPYILWVGFATVLNLAIVILN